MTHIQKNLFPTRMLPRALGRVVNAGNHVAAGKRGKTCSRWQPREISANGQVLSSHHWFCFKTDWLTHCSNPVHFGKGESSRYKFSALDFPHPYDNKRIVVDVMGLQSEESLVT